jgi:hypothetical protein
MPHTDHAGYVGALPGARVELLKRLRKPLEQRTRACSEVRALRELDEFIANALTLPTLAPVRRVGDVAFPSWHNSVARARVRDDGHTEQYAFAVLGRVLEQGGVLRMLLAEAWTSPVTPDATGRGIGVRVGQREVRSAARVYAVVDRPHGPQVVLLRTRRLSREVTFDVLSTAREVCSTALMVVEDLRDCGVLDHRLAHVPVVLPPFRAARMAETGPVYGPREFASRLISVSNFLMRHVRTVPVVLCDEPAHEVFATDQHELRNAVADAVVTTTPHERLPATRVIVNRVQGARPSFVTTLPTAGPHAPVLARVLQLLEEPRHAMAIRTQRRELAALLDGDALQSSLTTTHDLFATTVAGYFAGRAVVGAGRCRPRPLSDAGARRDRSSTAR